MCDPIAFQKKWRKLSPHQVACLLQHGTVTTNQRIVDIHDSMPPVTRIRKGSDDAACMFLAAKTHAWDISNATHTTDTLVKYLIAMLHDIGLGNAAQRLLLVKLPSSVAQQNVMDRSLLVQVLYDMNASGFFLDKPLSKLKELALALAMDMFVYKKSFRTASRLGAVLKSYLLRHKQTVPTWVA